MHFFFYSLAHIAAGNAISAGTESRSCQKVVAGFSLEHLHDFLKRLFCMTAHIVVSANDGVRHFRIFEGCIDGFYRANASFLNKWCLIRLVFPADPGKELIDIANNFYLSSLHDLLSLLPSLTGPPG